MHPAVQRSLFPLVLSLALALASCRGSATHEPPSSRPPTPEPLRPRFHEVAPGIRLSEVELPYDAVVAEIDVVRLDLAAVDLGMRKLDDRRFAPLLDDPLVDVAINGGFFERDFRSSGLVVVGGVVLSEADPRGGSGVVVVEGDRARLVASDAAIPGLDQVALAIQCGPRLVETDGSIGIARDDGKRAARTALCIRDGGRTLDLVVARRRDGLGGPGLLTLATWLGNGLLPGETRCDAALNLDGGPSTAIYVRSAPSARRLPPGPVVDALVVRSRVVPGSSAEPTAPM